jgi:hypothetical protein
MPQNQRGGPLGVKVGGGGLRDFLGNLGDALLVANGAKPIYRERQNAKRISQALSSYLGDTDQALAQIFEIDPEAGLALYKLRHPANEVPADIRNYQYYQGLPDEQKHGYENYLRLTHPGFMAPITLPEGATLETPGAAAAPSGGEVTATNPQTGEKVRLNPSTNQWEPLGGPTASPSGGFSVTARNNNPGALRVPGSKQFQRFASPEQGIQAQEALLGRYHQRGLNSVSKVVETYAPRKSRGGDNTDAQVNNYIAYVSHRLGVDPSAAIPPAMVPQLAQAMREFETGQRAN